MQWPAPQRLHYRLQFQNVFLFIVPRSVNTLLRVLAFYDVKLFLFYLDKYYQRLPVYKTLFPFTCSCMYTRINATKPPASGGDKISKRRLMPQLGRVRELVFSFISVFLHSERWRC
jgi:hypothetical protein